MGYSHKPGPLKQANKKHKKGTGRSKRTVKQTQGGKIQKVSKSEQHTSSKTQSKILRQQQVEQLRKNKRYEQLFQKRLGSVSGPPRIAVVVPLTETADPDQFISSILAQATSFTKKENSYTVVHALFQNLKARCTFIQCPSRNIIDTLDVCHAADMIIFISKETMTPGELIDETGYEVISALKSFGLPDTFFTLQTETMTESSKSNSDNKISLQKYIQREFDPNSKVYDDQSSAQLQLLIRNITSCALRPIHWRNNRSYVVSDQVQFVKGSTLNQQGLPMHTVQISGYIRGRPLHVNSLIHITGCGTHRIISVELANDPSYPSSKPVNFDYSSSRLFADPNKQDSLTMEATPESLMGEQTWPSEEEMAGSGHNESNKGNGESHKRPIPSEIKIPEGMSKYQADWLIDDEGGWHEDNNDRDDSDEDDNDDENDEDENDDGDDSENMDNEQTFGQPLVDEDHDETSIMDDDDDLGQNAKSDKQNTAGSDKIDKSDRKVIQKLEEEDREFPDEIDTPADIAARDRFARYRALQSFRSSPWHPKENLPQQYNKIYQFENFNGTQKRVLEEGAQAERRQLNEEVMSLRNAKMQSSKGKSLKDKASIMDIDGHKIDDLDGLEGVSMTDLASGSSRGTIFGMDGFFRSGQYVTITIEVISDGAMQGILDSYTQNGGFLSLFSLLKHENKLSVLHFTIQRTEAYQEPIRAKDELFFQVGNRKYWAKPVFSEANLNSDKHKSERFLRHGKFSVATVIGPISYSPCPVMVYKRLDNGKLILVASGSLTSVNPDRIVLKRVILTGYPIRVRNKVGVVKHMFYNPEDVLWFKPAELVTKHGLRGHITETVGTHGLFKSQFSACITQNDTVMLILYKRVYPKFPSESLIVT